MVTHSKASDTDLAVDRNFDDLASRFQRNVYGGNKGRVRLQVLQKDFAEFVPEKNSATPLNIFDAGGGLGQMSLEFAMGGHQVTLCDISENMLAYARGQLEEAGVADRVIILHDSIQNVADANQEPFDGVLCHAVMEWVADPKALLKVLSDSVKPGGFLSLTFYNLDGSIYKNLLRGNFKKIRKGSYKGYRGSLTPQNPLKPSDVLSWYAELPLDILCCSGIRVFHDYIFDPVLREQKADEIVEMELKHSRLSPYWQLGRYIHLLARKR